jgi:thiol:disulfide interchange protein DsbC
MERNLEFARKYRINGTPALFFVDGTRVPGVVPVEKLEQLLASSSAKAASSTNN